MRIKFYDTCSLLIKAGSLFEDGRKIALSTITLQELEDIKTNRNKAPDVKAAARQVLIKIDTHPDLCEIVIYKEPMGLRIKDKYLEISHDTQILACANWLNDTEPYVDEVTFVTNDMALKQLARLFFGDDSIESVQEDEKDLYTGFVEVALNEGQLADLYSNLDRNTFSLLVNQYLLVRDLKGEVVDKLKWNGNKHIAISYANFESRHFGKVKPMKDDPYQAFLADSLINNKITLVRGNPGTGKSFLSLAYLFHKLATHDIDRVIIFCNTVAAKNAARLGLIFG